MNTACLAAIFLTDKRHHHVNAVRIIVCLIALFPAIYNSRALAAAADTPTTLAPSHDTVSSQSKVADQELTAVPQLTDQLLKQIESEKAGDLWDEVNRLVRLGRNHGALVTDKLESRLLFNDQKVQLACARALCQLNCTQRAGPLLAKLLQNSESVEIRQLAANAIGLTTPLYGDEATGNALLAALQTEKDDLTRISIARGLWRVTARNDGKDALLKIMAESADASARDEAALVLAENGFLHLNEVRLRLLNLYSEPTAHGERAFNLLRRSAEEDSNRSAGINDPDPKEVQGEQLMRELVQEIKHAYPDPSKCNADKLFEDAAKGMVAGLDPFSQYMDRDEVVSTQEMLQQDYGGIGAYVGFRNNAFIVTSPIYGSPADKAGLRALDIIQEVDGHKTNEMADKGGVNGVILRLKGKPGTAVKIKYYRRGFYKPMEVDIVRENIRVESVLSALLPGQIGYIRLTRFGERSSEEVQAALDVLLKDQKAKAIIFDLRDNPGGLLNAGVEIAGKFLDANKLIVYSQGNQNFAPYRSYMSKGSPENESFPLVLLVGAGSASASEIVSGAMQDLKRAVLVGEKTFGKGSVQQIMPVHATDKQTELRLTIAKYYLPSGRCIHEKGVDVDVEAKQPELHGWVVEQLADLRRQNVFEDYIRKTWDTNHALYLKLAINDEHKTQSWPGFDDYYKSLNTRIDPDDIRAELRASVRRRVQDEQKHEFVFDLEEDVVLQRGILEVLKPLHVEATTVAEYKGLPEKFQKKPESDAHEN